MTLKQKSIKKIMTTRVFFEADLMIVAMGTWSRLLTKKISHNVPILGGKGYSLISNHFTPKPKHPIMLIEKKIAITPRRNSVRIAGTLELVKNDDAISTKRIEAILKGTRLFFDLPKDLKISEVWRGLRPCTPDGVPIV
jgi:D-amino-acid dehydrogenase